jgi:hypothetical protein
MERGMLRILMEMYLDVPFLLRPPPRLIDSPAPTSPPVPPPPTHTHTHTHTRWCLAADGRVQGSPRASSTLSAINSRISLFGSPSSYCRIAPLALFSSLLSYLYTCSFSLARSA